RGRWRAAASLALASALFAVTGADGPPGGPWPPGATPAGWRPWLVSVGSGTYAEPGCVRPVAGALYCTERMGGRLYRFDAATGRALWKVWYADDDLVTPTVVAVSSDVVLVRRDSTDATPALRLDAVDAATGAPLWHRSLTAETFPTSPLADMAGGVAVVAIQGTVTGYDARSGKRLWTHRTGGGDECRLQMLGLTAVAGCGTVGEDKATMVTAAYSVRDGEPRWSTSHPYYLYPMVAGAGRIVVGVLHTTGDGPDRTGVLDPDTGRVTLLAQGPGPGALPDEEGVIVGDVYYQASDDSSVSALDLRTGARLWRERLRFDNPSRPVVAADRIYVTTPTGRVAALDRATGDPLWYSEPPEGTRTTSSGIESPPSLVGDVLYVPCGGGVVYSLDVTAPEPGPPARA
ncbi:PQQ-binding-like beta-propeller repeat protein, partial [Streptomyces sp. NPDC051940]|uniref:outer membrane protein assembly factor BamB family protein n=1 Tax=Streptomyces sp. NPDC051940 TaxID=3155675 RepID=UPI003439B83B